MKFKAIWKDTFREIRKSLMRFLAILIIIFLGVGFYVGISATSPDMLLTSDQYFTDLNLMDFKIQSSYGLTADDIEELEQMDDITVQSHYAHDFIIENSSLTIRLYSFDLTDDQAINQYYLIDGRLPKTPNEIALDNKFADMRQFEIGDTLSLELGENGGDPEEYLNRFEYEIVGFVNSPMFIENGARGTTTVGSGTLSGFGVIAEENYDSDIFTEAYLTIDGATEYDAYSDDYEEFVEGYEPNIDSKLADLETRREGEVLTEIQDEIADGWAQIGEGEQELADAEAELADAREELDRGWAELADGRSEFDNEMQNAEAEISRNEQQLRDGLAEVEENERQLRAQQAELQEQRAELDENEPLLIDGINQAETGILQLESGLEELANQRSEAESGLIEIDRQIEETKATIAQLEQLLALPELPPGYEREELEQGLTDAQAGLALLEEARTETTTGLNLIDENQQMLEAELANAQTQLAELQEQLEQLQSGRVQIVEGLAQIDNGLTQLQTARSEIQNGFTEIENAKKTLATERQNALDELDDAEQDLTDAEAEYTDGLATFAEESADAREELADGRAELEELEEDLENLPMPTYYLFDRADNPGYSEYKDNTDRLAIIAVVFPGFFFLIAIFISFTTMTRMVDEEREYIGIMKAMGYENRHILIKFITYATLATTIGAVLGLFFGYIFIPELIFYAYSSMYNFPETVLAQFTTYTVFAMLAAYISTVGASLLAVRYSLRSNAATLLQPKAPRKGTRILLERIGFIWRRLSFNYKITFRNVFRYKSRMLMTIFGIAGSTGLILTGFGISDSISDVPSVQYGEINQFQAYVALDPNIEKDELTEYEEAMSEYEIIADYLFVSQENVTAEQDGLNTQTITLFVPDDPSEINEFVKLANVNNEDEIYTLNDESAESGAYITQKLASLFELEIGDQLEVISTDDEIWTIEVAGILENYIGHTAYMTPDYYSQITGSEIEMPNVQLIKYDEKIDADALGSDLMNEDQVVGISYVADIYNSFSGTLNSLDLITQILVIAAAALAFIVLYNLTNINVSERNRELSTIKVLGSHDHEVTMYIYRENFILTFLGIIVGLIFGTLLTNFITATMEVDMLVFGREVHLSSYLYSSVLTVLFTLIVMVVIHFQLKRIDMVEALKAND